MTDDELYMCKNATAGEDSDGLTIPWCKLHDLPCDAVMRFADYSCEYEKEGVRDDI